MKQNLYETSDSMLFPENSKIDKICDCNQCPKYSQMLSWQYAKKLDLSIKQYFDPSRNKVCKQSN